MASDGHRYEITGHAKEWTVTHVAPTGRKTVLAEKVGYAAAAEAVKKANAERVAKAAS
jgi:hypothetical protein